MNGVKAEAGTEPVGGVVEVVPPLEKSRLAVLRSKSWAWVTSPVLTRRFKVFGLVPVPLVIPVAVVLGVVVLGVVVLGVVVVGVVVVGATDGGGIDRKLVPSGPANCGAPKMNVLGLAPVVALAAGVVRVITPDEVDTPDGVGTSIGASTLATGVGAVGVVVVVVGVVVVGVVVVGVVVVGVVVVGVVVVGVVVVGVVVVGVVVLGVVVVGVAICATLTPEAVESATAVIEAQAISDKSLVSLMADLPDSEHQGNAIPSFPIQILHNGCRVSTYGT